MRTVRNYYYYYYLFVVQIGFCPEAVALQYDITHKNTHISQNITPRSNKTKHNTQSYTNNKGHITHNEYNTHKK
jgi:hypothetical protein